MQNLDTCSAVQNLYKPSASFQCRQMQGSVWHLFNESSSSYREKNNPLQQHTFCRNHDQKTQRQSLTAARRVNTVCANRQDWGGLFHLCGTSEGRVFNWWKQHLDLKKKKKITKITHLLCNILQNPNNCIYEAAGRLTAHFDTDSWRLRWEEKLVREETEVQGFI